MATAAELATDYQPMARAVAREMYRDGFRQHGLDELEGWALEALVAVANRFDTERDVPFANYARPRIRWAVIDACRSYDHARGDVARTVSQLNATKAASLDGFMADDVDHPDLPVAGDDPADLAVARDELGRLRQLLAELSDRQRDVILARATGISNDAIGERWGVTGSRVSQIRSETIAELRRQLAA